MSRLGVKCPSTTGTPDNDMVCGVYFQDFIRGLIALVQPYSKIPHSRGP